MITLTQEFILNDPVVSAGSGLVLHEGTFYIISDDELGMVSQPLDFSRRGAFHQVFPGRLPEETEERKRLKPDLECLLVTGNDLLLIPSGSKPNRIKGALVSLSDFSVTPLSFGKVFQELEKYCPELNIEGAVVLDKTIRLFQRGNGKLHQNAIIDLPLPSFLKDEVKDISVLNIDLGTICDTPLSFTDATINNDEIIFIAVAEKSESTYLDGDYVGSVIGKMSFDGKVLLKKALKIDSKPEGIAIKGNTFYVVTDDDQRDKPSRIFSGNFQQLTL
ncbi:MAG: DUF6929 family protein [Bacteriovoracia bacterium]